MPYAKEAMPAAEELIGAREYGAIVGVSPQAARYHLARQYVPAWEIAGRLYCRRVDAERYAKTRKHRKQSA